MEKNFSGVRQVILKYFGLAVSLTGATVMLLFIRSGAFDLFESFYTSVFTGITGMIMFFLGIFFMAKADEDFMERVLERVGKVLELLS